MLYLVLLEAVRAIVGQTDGAEVVQYAHDMSDENLMALIDNLMMNNYITFPGVPNRVFKISKNLKIGPTKLNYTQFTDLFKKKIGDDINRLLDYRKEKEILMERLNDSIRDARMMEDRCCNVDSYFTKMTYLVLELLRTEKMIEEEDIVIEI